MKGADAEATAPTEEEDQMAQTETVREIEGLELPPAGTYVIDPAHSSVEFVVRHLLSKARGRFTDFSGEIVVGDGPEDSSASVDIVASSVNTNQEMRDNHLKSGDFLLTEEHPKITFRSKAVRPTGGNTFELDGDLTIRGITKPVTLESEFAGTGVTTQGTTVLGFSAATSVDREAFGITWNAALEAGGVALGKKVGIQIDVELLKAE
jgi:polyisoprenoid-binding protein YceI